MQNAYPIARSPIAATAKELHVNVQVCFVVAKPIFVNLSKYYVEPDAFIRNYTELHGSSAILNTHSFSGTCQVVRVARYEYLKSIN